MRLRLSNCNERACGDYVGPETPVPVEGKVYGVSVTDAARLTVVALNGDMALGSAQPRPYAGAQRF
jgi:hypothetical protein